MTRRLFLALPLAGCAVPPPVPSHAQLRAVCEAERTRRGISRLLPPEARARPECATPGAYAPSP